MREFTERHNFSYLTVDEKNAVMRDRKFTALNWLCVGLIGLCVWYVVFRVSFY